MTEIKTKRRWFRFSLRDFIWLTILIVMAGAWSWHHRYTTRQLNFCIEALHQVEQELDVQYADADRQINSLRYGRTGAESAAAAARSNAAVSAELEYQFERATLAGDPSPTPLIFIGASMKFRFTICDVLRLTALVAMGVAWWLNHRAQVERYQSLLPPQFVVCPMTTANPNAVLKMLQSKRSTIHIASERWYPSLGCPAAGGTSSPAAAGWSLNPGFTLFRRSQVQFLV